MVDLTTQDVRGRTLVALFDSRDAADRAVRDLEVAGVPRQHITRTESGTASTNDAVGGTGLGLWDELKNLFVPDEDRHAYSEGIRRGGFLVSVRTEEANITRVMDILDRDGAVDLDAREQTWRSEGWTGQATAGAVTGSAALPIAGAAAAGTGRASPDLTAQNLRSAEGVAAGAVETGRDDVISLYEEQIRIGKRDVSHGRVRLRSYVVETPVTEQVGLRQERVTVERRPVERAVTDATGDVFREQVIEVEERGEEAVVGKEVRIREEIALRKETGQRTETISDTVRRTEVDIDDQRAAQPVGRTGQATGLTGFASQIVEHMEVIGSDGQKIGIVDHLDGTDRIKLAKSASPDGQHHFIPLAWIDHVDTHVHLKRTALDARSAW